MAQQVKNLPAVQEMQEAWVSSLGQEDPLKEGMVTHSSTLAWRTLWTEDLEGCGPWGPKESNTTEATAHTVGGKTDQQAKPVATQSTALMRTRDSFQTFPVCVCLSVCVLLCRRRKFEK